MRRIADSVGSVLDIGGTLRIDAARSSRVDPRNTWVKELLSEKKVAYRVLDYVDTYHPDIVGDIQSLPLPDASEEAIICLSVLEHVENPFKAAAELHRVLKPGGMCLISVPFLFYYHAEKGYYGDYWRFTEDSLRLLFKPFSKFEICPVRLPVETLIRLTPLGRSEAFLAAGRALDGLLYSKGSKQVSGYYLFLVK